MITIQPGSDNVTGSKAGSETVSTEAGGAILALLRCPMCRFPLFVGPVSADDVERLNCTGCPGRYPVRWGIPDLRPPGVGDPYLTTDEDLRAAEKLVRRAERDDFAAVLASYYETNARVPAAQARRFTLGALAALGRSEVVLRAWRELARQHSDGSRGTLLDVGCGSGPLSVAATSAGFRTVGLDVGLRWLVLASARARDAGIRLTTVCAGAECLPFAHAALDVVASEYLLENVVPAEPVLAEAARVLRPGGQFWCATANRWSLGPDPHLGVPFSGWWPAVMANRYASFRHQVPPQRHLLGAGALRRSLAKHGFSRTRIGPAPIAESQRQSATLVVRVAVDLYERISATAAGQSVLNLIGPSVIATAERTTDHEAAS